MAPPNPDEHTMDRRVGAGNGFSGIDIALHPTQSGFMKRPSWEQQTELQLAHGSVAAAASGRRCQNHPHLQRLHPGEVEKIARKAGFSHPVGEMTCSSRCEQRWAKE
ncbi:MAG: hypothetical protein RLZZ106_527 [Cyanobacteriota bacterium]|jgi:hypothetical protein